ncbi:MAG: hypothetical protein KatS3mg115_0474 [Candidatus Poribacteria bacterium]|nr:MAG: hypothetical protein KatS3mg115_0474 [Candidatus Poribacteria bacterium]
MDAPREVERWGVFEVSVGGPEAGNPFLDVAFGAEFRYKHRVVPVDGFYDGNGVYRVRFSPDTEGEWRFTTTSNVPELAGKSGTFRCISPGPNNHGPVRVEGYHFRYADGTPYYQVGTTCYAWIHQPAELQEQTLETLRSAPFNKLRMCIFPKHYIYNQNEPDHFPFVGSKEKGFDWTRFNPEFWKNLERRVEQLMEMGIQADLILFHPYDRWGFASMDRETEDRYLRYTVARLAAFRNVWWSFANEYDLMRNKTMADWDHYFLLVQQEDPYQRLRSIHNCRTFYDHNKPWVTHQSIQADPSGTPEWRRNCPKPVVVDECRYEGNIPRHWGNISAREMVHRFWVGTVAGGYVGHGETYLHPEDILWWSKGGVLHGESPPRIAFLRRILEEGPPVGFEPVAREGAAKGDEVFLYYFGLSQPARFTFNLPEEPVYRAELIDPWEMTITPIPGKYRGQAELSLPGRPYLAVRFWKIT